MTKLFRTTTQLGPFFSGEVPEPLQVTFQDADGNAIDLTGYSVDFAIEVVQGGAGVDTAVGDGAASFVSASTGVVKYVWRDGDTDFEGLYRGQFWVTNGSQWFASEMYEWVVTAGLRPDLP